MSQQVYTKSDLDELVRSKIVRSKIVRIERLKQIDNRMTAIAVLIKRVGSKKEFRDLTEERESLVKEKTKTQQELTEKNELIRIMTLAAREPSKHEAGWVTIPELAAKIDRVEKLLQTLVDRFDSLFGAIDEVQPSPEEVAELEAVE